MQELKKTDALAEHKGISLEFHEFSLARNPLSPKESRLPVITSTPENVPECIVSGGESGAGRVRERQWQYNYFSMPAAFESIRHSLYHYFMVWQKSKTRFRPSSASSLEF